MGIPIQYNIGGYLHGDQVLLSSQFNTWSSDGAPNNTEQIGRIIDRTLLGRHYLSAKIVVPGTVSSTAGSTGVSASITTRVLHATSTGATFTALGSTGVVTNLISSATSTDLVIRHEQDVDLRTARRYLQVAITGRNVSSSSGSMKINPSIVFGGGDEVPSVLVGTQP